jgi:CheY-like chemotaxis protein
MILAQQPNVEVVSAKDGIDGLVLLKTNAEDVRLCLADMVMPGLSGIELLNRARADPTLEHVTFALMTEFSSGKLSAKKSLSHFQVSDDRGGPVSVLIKPLHHALIGEMLANIVQDTAVPPPLIRKHSEATLLNAGMQQDPEWQRMRSRSDWGKKPRPLSTDLSLSSSSRSPTPPVAEKDSPGREIVSPRGSSNSRLGSVASSVESSPRRPGSATGSPRRGSGSYKVDKDGRATPTLPTGAAESPRTRKKSLTISHDTRLDADALLSGSGGIPRSASQYQIGTEAASSPAIPRSTSVYVMEGSHAPPSPMLPRVVPRGSPKSSPRLGRSSWRTKTRDSASPPVGLSRPDTPGSNGSPRPEGSPESSTVEQGSKRWSMRHNQDGVPDESQGVNSIMFDSISSLDRDSVQRSVSMDQLNWDDVAN